MVSFVFLFIISTFLILSYGFNWVANRCRIPAVLLLIGTGLLIRISCASWIAAHVHEIMVALKILGALGLMIIVLDGALRVDFLPQKSEFFIRAGVFLAVVFFTTTAILAVFFRWFFHSPLHNAVVYAIPLSIISSAIAIPSAVHLSPCKQEFIIFESTICDVIGIFLFNYLIEYEPSLLGFFGKCVLDVLVGIPAMGIFVMTILYFLSLNRASIKMIPFIALIVVGYVGLHIFHLPALFAILMVGVVLNNIPLVSKHIWFPCNIQNLIPEIPGIKTFVAEISFLVRTLFFIILGLTIPVERFLHNDVFAWAGGIYVLILLARFASLVLIKRTSDLDILWIAPRGLITIGLYFLIPENLHIQSFSDAIVYAVVIFSSLGMIPATLMRDKGQS